MKLLLYIVGLFSTSLLLGAAVANELPDPKCTWVNVLFGVMLYYVWKDIFGSPSDYTRDRT